MPIKKQKLNKPEPRDEGAETWRLQIVPEDKAYVQFHAERNGMTPAKFIAVMIAEREALMPRLTDALSTMEIHNENFQRVDDRLTVAQNFIASRTYVDAHVGDLNLMLAKMKNDSGLADAVRDYFNKTYGPDALDVAVGYER